MKNIEITPAAYKDLEGLKMYLTENFDGDVATKELKQIFKDLRRLAKYPDTDIKLFERFGITTDYKCILTQKNYAFYRIEGDSIKVIRILDNRRDFLYILLGIHMSSDESEGYWDE
ncbi:MAG: type II toxin-antitoxin system RelE/ParE family toxin [Lachnospiraceae bacterium]|nr:type II toxin-antitoxin system RelE/ParE family toxin [Lachnospiraceae bacterium]